MFQSTAGPKTGCTVHRRAVAQRGSAFQSTAGPKTGCTPSCSTRSIALSCFNPQPARRPAAPGSVPHVRTATDRFNPQPARRPAAPCCRSSVRPYARVSIHSRPEDRLHPGTSTHCDSLCAFQSTAGPKTGCTRGMPIIPLASRGFNPQPARRPAAPRSISTRAGRASCFNPQPARRPAAPRGSSTACRGRKSFNPQPARRPAAPAT